MGWWTDGVWTITTHSGELRSVSLHLNRRPSPEVTDKVVRKICAGMPCVYRAGYEIEWNPVKEKSDV